MTEPVNAQAQPVFEIIEDSLHWLTEALALLFYKGDGTKFDFTPPRSYMAWIADPETAKLFQKSVLERVRESANLLIGTLKAASENRPPLRGAYDAFMQAFEDFMVRLNELENESIISGQGIDTQTGFKNAAIMIQELKKELNRRERRGSPFSIAMIRIDGDDTDVALEFKVRTLSDAIRQCMRSFDDVYKIGERDFVAGLKHSDLRGGLRFIERVKLELKNRSAGLTFSSCVGEPDPADDLDAFMNNIKNDLDRIATAGTGQSVKFEDISPLQRFVASMKNNNQ